MTRTGEIVQDLTKGVVPVMAVLGILGAVWTAATWVAGTDSTTNQMAAQMQMLASKVDALTVQVGTISSNLAQGPKLPDNLVYQSDILRLCLLNPKLICPEARR